jgi:poly(A) polymerase
MKEMLVLQRRFTNTKGVRAAKLIEHKRFRAAYDFLVLRSRCGEVEAELAEFWTDAQKTDGGDRTAAFETEEPRRKKRRRRSRRGGRRGPSDS